MQKREVDPSNDENNTASQQKKIMEQESIIASLKDENQRLDKQQKAMGGSIQEYTFKLNRCEDAKNNL